MKQLTIRIPHELHEQMERVAEERYTTVAQLARQLIGENVPRPRFRGGVEYAPEDPRPLKRIGKPLSAVRESATRP